MLTLDILCSEKEDIDGFAGLKTQLINCAREKKTKSVRFFRLT